MTEDEKARVRELVAEEERLATLEAGEEEAEAEEPEVVGGEGEGVEERPRRTLGWCIHTHSRSHTLTEREREIQPSYYVCRRGGLWFTAGGSPRSSGGTTRPCRGPFRADLRDSRHRHQAYIR